MIKEVSTFRLYLMRAMYLLLVVGIAFTIWPQIINHPKTWPLWHGVGCSLLAATSILAAVGLRYPLVMLPVLFFEMIWKSIWLIAVAYPLWSTDDLDPVNLETAQNCLVGAIIPFTIPWRYVWTHYIKMPGNRWT